MDFRQKKNQSLKNLDKGLQLGEVDEDILSLIQRINSYPYFFTTSSCSGRIVIHEIESVGKKDKSNFIFKIHQKPDYFRLQYILLNYEFENDTWLRVEPPILHLGTNNLEKANEILKLGFSAGLKRSGIRSINKEWIIVQLWGTGHIDVPLGGKNKNFLKNNKEYINFLLEKAEKSFNHGKNQLNTLETAFQIYETKNFR